MFLPRAGKVLIITWLVAFVSSLAVGLPTASATASAIAAPTPIPLASAPPLSVYPKYVAIKKVGGTVPDVGPTGTDPPTKIVAKAKATVKLEGGIFNASHNAQKAVVHFGIDCWTSSFHEVMQDGPNLTLTVPGDPAFLAGLAVMARVTGTFTIPSICAHTSDASDGSFEFEVTSPATTGSPGLATEAFSLGSTIPGAGFPPVGTAGTVVLWRAVDTRELNAIKAAGKRFTLGPGDEGKYFFPTKAQAQSLGQIFEKKGYGDYMVTSAEVEDSVFDAGAVDSIAPLTEGKAWYFLESALEAVGEVAILE